MGRAEDYSSSRQYSVHGSFSGQNSNSAVCGNSFRPGIVARLTKRVLECRGNVAESRMARLAGDFTILMLITFDIA